MKIYLSFYCFLVLVLLFRIPAQSQEVSEMEDLIPALSTAISFYRENIKDDSFIYEGREYVGFHFKIEGHAFFGSNEWQLGDLVYKGQFFRQVPMLYDITAEEVVVRHYGKFFRVKLYRQKIEHFSLLNHHFINISGKDVRGAPMIPGFYDHLYKGSTNFFVKRSKVIKETYINNELHREFIRNDLFFIEKEGVYYPVKTKKSVLRVLEDQKKETRKFLKKNKIKFRRNTEYAIASMVEFYDQAYTR